MDDATSFRSMDESHGVVLLHEIFQGYHYFAKVGGTPA